MATARKQARFDLYLSENVPAERALAEVLRAHPRRQEMLRELVKVGLADQVERGVIDPSCYDALDLSATADLKRSKPAPAAAQPAQVQETQPATPAPAQQPSPAPAAEAAPDPAPSPPPTAAPTVGAPSAPPSEAGAPAPVEEPEEDDEQTKKQRLSKLM